MDIQILLADDDAVLRSLVCDILEKQRFVTHDFQDGQAALEYFYSHSNEIDLVILDVMMPRLDGWEVLKAIREKSEVPVLMLTALGQESNELLALKIGADEYIAKPFSYKIFVARVNTLLRRVLVKRDSFVEEGCLKINRQNHTVFVENREIALDNKEYQLLTYFVDNKDQVLQRERILDAVWGYDFEGDIRTIDTHIKTLRAKLLSCSPCIQTVRGIGYRWEARQ
jgi:DNA-binding response OmpR family regulator